MFALANVWQTPVFAAPRTVYQGTLQGAGEIVMELDSQPATNGEIGGRYFYARFGVDIPLKGKPNDLREPLALADLRARTGDNSAGGDGVDFDEPAAIWKGTLDGTGYRGSWIDQRTGATRTFALKRIAQYDPDKVAPDAVEAVTKDISGGVGSGIAFDADINATQAPYETRKLEGRAQPVGPEIGDGVVAYRMWRDPRTKFLYPRLSRYPDAQRMAHINHLLEQRQWQLSLAALACVATRYTDDGPAAGTLGDIDDEIVEVTWLSTALLGVTEAGSSFCGGAHPDNHYVPITFDLLRGDYLDWNRILKAYQMNKDGFPEPTAQMTDFIKRTHDRGLKVKGSDSDEDLDCADELPEYLAYALYAPNTLGFVVSGIGHALGACLGPQVKVTFDRLTPVLQPDAARYLVPSVKLAPVMRTGQ
ncbi:hypothetical protein G3N59_06890 [Paraburkholderia sp. Ac-20340]|nr:hypothetical protein [Paraburkholderia sp. Ac-20340]